MRAAVAIIYCLALVGCPAPPTPPPPVLHQLTLTVAAAPGVRGVNFYCGEKSGAESATPINSAVVSGTTYSTTNVVAGQAYFCVAQFVAASGELGPKSNEVEGVIP